MRKIITILMIFVLCLFLIIGCTKEQFDNTNNNTNNNTNKNTSQPEITDDLQSGLDEIDTLDNGFNDSIDNLGTGLDELDC